MHIAPIRQRIAKDLLTLERHGGQTRHNLRARALQRLLAPNACVYLNPWLGRPTRALADYIAKPPRNRSSKRLF